VVINFEKYAYFLKAKKKQINETVPPRNLHTAFGSKFTSYKWHSTFQFNCHLRNSTNAFQETKWSVQTF